MEKITVQRPSGWECETLPECEAGQRVQGRFVRCPFRHSRAGSACMRAALCCWQNRTRKNRISNSWGRAAASVPAPTGCSKGSAQPCAAAWMARPAALAAMTVEDRRTFPGLAQRLPGRGPCPCAGGERNAYPSCAVSVPLDARRKKERWRRGAAPESSVEGAACVAGGRDGFHALRTRRGSGVVSALGWLYAPPDTPLAVLRIARQQAAAMLCVILA